VALARYHFILDGDGRRIDDETGTYLVDDLAARDHAHRIVAELQADADFADYHGDRSLCGMVARYSESPSCLFATMTLPVTCHDGPPRSGQRKKLPL
jgi:hypothetical protein